MTAIVSLRAVVQEMDVHSDQHHAYLNKRTGELVTIGDEEINIVESGENIEDYPEWQREAIRKTQELVNSDEYLPLPSKFDIHEYANMERFCRSRDDRDVRERLLYYIHGTGAFRLFKDAIRELGIVDDWYLFRQSALEEIAIDWLDANGIQYTSDDW
ncbi:MAG: hypothetical protein FJ217_08645 [Ignavibacteria bacterium]|nr:hypothetical protein [Ignavibacteria bacterium]